MRVQSVMMIRVLNQTAQTAMRTQTIMMLMQQQMVRHLAMALARILMMTLAFLMLARLELVTPGVEGVGKGKGRRIVPRNVVMGSLGVARWNRYVIHPRRIHAKFVRSMCRDPVECVLSVAGK